MSIRVLHVINQLELSGGAEQQLVNLLFAQDQRKVSAAVVTLYDQLDLAEPLRRRGVAVQTLGLTSVNKQWPLAVWRLRGCLRAFRPDIVQTWHLEAAIVSRPAAKVEKVTVVSSVQAPVYSPDVYLDNPDLRRMRLEAMRLADMVTGKLSRSTYVACSHHVADATAAALHLPAERMRVIYNSVTVPNYAGVSAGTDPIAKEQPVRLLNVGRLSPQKGQRYLLRALPAVVEEYPQVRLDIVGTGPLADELRQESERLGLGDHVQFLGKRDDVPALLQRAHLFVFPSLYEGLALAALEALAAGTPMVAADIPSIREIVRPGVEGLLVQPRNPDELAEAVLRLLGDAQLRNAFAHAGRRRVCEEFETSAVARQFEQLYSELRRDGA